MSESSRTSVHDEYEAAHESHGIFMKLYGAVWWSLFGLSALLTFAGVFLTWPIVVFDRKRKLLHMWPSLWGWGVYAINPFWTLRVEGREKLGWNQRAVVCPTHDSLADILVVGALFWPFKFVSKESIFKIPFVGWGMKLVQDISLTRGDAASIVKMLAECRDWLNRDVPVLLFPEGTRSKDGLVRPFKNGAFQLAIETNSPIVPVVLAGTRDTLPKYGWVPPLESHVRVKVLDPVYPAEFQGNLEALREHVRTVMIAEKARQTELLRNRRF